MLDIQKRFSARVRTLITKKWLRQIQEEEAQLKRAAVSNQANRLSGNQATPRKQGRLQTHLPRVHERHQTSRKYLVRQIRFPGQRQRRARRENRKSRLLGGLEKSLTSGSDFRNVAVETQF